jgi:hypothetical protein
MCRRSCVTSQGFITSGHKPSLKKREVTLNDK